MSIRIAAAQINPTVGDLNGNRDKILHAIDSAGEMGCDLVCFPELAITGYPPEDLILKEGFVRDARRVLDEIAAATGDCVVIVGTVVNAQEDGIQVVAANDARHSSGQIFNHPILANVAAVLFRGEVVGFIAKQLLPNYGVFDEQRLFLPGILSDQVFVIAGVPVGVMVCEDLWMEDGPAQDLADGGASVIVSINASPFSVGQDEARFSVISNRAKETNASIVYVNQVGGQDELVFDGSSMVVDQDGKILSNSPSFVEDLLVYDLDISKTDERKLENEIIISEAVRSFSPRVFGFVNPALSEEAQVYSALVLGLHDYLGKNGFTDVVIGLSGGVDSSAIAAIAVDAIGANHVLGISQPSRYSSDHSRGDAQELADRLGIKMNTIFIEPAHASITKMIGGVFKDDLKGLTDENLQARIRAVSLMGIANNMERTVVLTTGNRSELAVGYFTLGDSIGGFSTISDVPKTMLFNLCRYRNELAIGRDEVPPIPESVISKPPSAELSPGQEDSDSLPPYDILDPILKAYIEDNLTTSEIVDQGFDFNTVKRVVGLVDSAEFKRRQLPMGIKITSKSFGRDRRMPITNRYRPQI